MIARVIWAIFLVSIISSPVLGLSLIKSDVPASIDVLTHRTEKVTYTIKGDNNTHQIELFAKSTNPSKLLINGKTQYSQNTTLSPFQTREVDLVLDGVADGNAVVTFGARSKGNTNGTVGFDQVVQSTFDVDVDCTIECQSSTTATTKKPSSSGGGGGGGIIPATVNSTNTSTVAELVVQQQTQEESAEEVPVVIDSVTNMDSATNELVVPQSLPREFVSNIAESVSTSVGEGANKDQLRTLGLLLFFSVGTLGTSLSVIAVKRGMEK